MNTSFYDEAALAERIGLSRRTLQRFRVTGEGMPFVRLGARRVVYRVADVEAWLAANSFPHRAAEMATKARK